MCVTACNKREAAAENAREATEKAREETQEAARAQEKAAEARQEAREAGADANYTKDKDGRLVDRNGRYVDENGRLVNKEGRLLDENGKVIDGETPPMRKAREEVRQTSRDVGKAMGRGADKVKEETRQTARDVSQAVDPDYGKTDADHSLNAQVRTALNKDPSVAGEAKGVSIRSEDGKVHLSGTVATTEAAKAIGKAAETVAGNGKVDNDIKVVERVGLFSGDRGKTEADKKVSERVREALKADKTLADDASDIHISTVNGEVNLTGTVATAEAAKAIGKVASTVAGAKKVDNDIKVTERIGAGTRD